ncbi:MAG: hydantoinase/oxoprolinase, partial [Acidobacteria bacterium]|nr:hydantoinase/oxoprolinase [Acidobacteriota bacterium]
PAEELTGATVEIIRPTARDEQDHLAIRTVAGEIIALTTTCAANLLGLVGTGHFAHGRPDSARLAFGQLAAWQGQKRSGEDLAGEVLRLACRTIETTIEDLIIEYQLPRDQVVLVGGGGGAAALVPFLANQMGLEHVERNIVDPTPEQILAVRREATAAAVNAGAVPGTIEVQVEVDRRRNLVRAVAVGTTELRPAVKLAQVSQAECQQAAARSMRVAADQLTLLASTAHYLVFATEHRTKSFFSAWRSPRPLLRVVDRTGVVRLQRNRARVTVTTPHQLDSELARAVDALTDFGDAGRTIPDIFILNGARVINFSGLTDLEQVVALARVELRSIEPDEELVVIACPKQV